MRRHAQSRQQPRAKALSRTADAHRMNKLEHEYAWHLEAGIGMENSAWLFEPIKLKLGDRCGYTPDFMVLLENGTIEFHETKGFWRDDARVKIKAAAHQYPMFRFLAIRKKPKKQGGGWDIEEIKT